MYIGERIQDAVLIVFKLAPQNTAAVSIQGWPRNVP